MVCCSQWCNSIQLNTGVGSGAVYTKMQVKMSKYMTLSSNDCTEFCVVALGWAIVVAWISATLHMYWTKNPTMLFTGCAKLCHDDGFRQYPHDGKTNITALRLTVVAWVRIFSRTTEIILCMCPANERRRYIVTSSLIRWAHSQNYPWASWRYSFKKD